MGHRRSERQWNGFNIARSALTHCFFFFFLFFQDRSINDCEMILETKRKKDENGTSTSNQSWSLPSTAPPGAKLQTSLPRFVQNQREPSLRLAALSREREGQKIQIVQQREGGVDETRAHFLRGQKGHPPPPFVDNRPSLFRTRWSELVSSRLCCRSPGTRKKNLKRKKRETAPEERKRKSNILKWNRNHNSAYLFLITLHFNLPVREAPCIVRTLNISCFLQQCDSKYGTISLLAHFFTPSVWHRLNKPSQDHAYVTEMLFTLREQRWTF